MRLAVLTGLYVAVVCSAQIGAQKIVDVPWTDLSAPGGTRLPDQARVIASNVVSAPLDSVVFLAIAFGSLSFLEGQVVAKLAATVVIGIPAVLALRGFFRREERRMVFQPR